MLAGARINGKMQGRQVLNATVVSTTPPVQQGEGMGVSRFVMHLRGPARAMATAVAQASGATALKISTMTSPTTATMDCTTEMVLVASPMVMPKDSLTIQKPAWLA